MKKTRISFFRPVPDADHFVTRLPGGRPNPVSPLTARLLGLSYGHTRRLRSTTRHQETADAF